MSDLDELCDALPEWAEDLRRNLAALERDSPLDSRQLWGTLLTCALATREPRLVALVDARARARLAPHERRAAASIAAIMAMNAIYFGSTHALADARVRGMPSRLRMQVMGRPGIARLDDELWCVAAAAIHGCAPCLDSHAQALLAAGGTLAQLHEVVRVAAILGGIAQALASATLLAES